MNYRSIGCLSLIALLSGCAGTGPSPEIASPSSNQVFSLEASGEQLFKCTRDTQGWYWKFVSPNAYLFDPATNQAVIKHGYRFGFNHQDGSRLSARIIKIHRLPDHLPEALFVTQSTPTPGALHDIAYVQRTKCHGGLPKTPCTAQKKDTILRVPYSATYIFFSK